jgi:hypothetical protein
MMWEDDVFRTTGKNLGVKRQEWNTIKSYDVGFGPVVW